MKIKYVLVQTDVGQCYVHMVMFKLLSNKDILRPLMVSEIRQSYGHLLGSEMDSVKFQNCLQPTISSS